jgi:hypothetical protein
VKQSGQTSFLAIITPAIVYDRLLSLLKMLCCARPWRELAPEQRKRTVWRIDGGGGSDDHLRWLLNQGYHVMVKGASHRRAEALSRQVVRWDRYRKDTWLGEVSPPVDYGRPVCFFVKKRIKNDRFVHSYYVSSLS